MEVFQEPRRLAARDGGLPTGSVPPGTQGRILEAALGLFAENGFAGTSIRDIADAAGVRSATLYAHYTSKEQLLADLIRLGHDLHHQRLREALLECRPDPREQLAALVRAHVKLHAELPRLALVANAELHALSPGLAAPALAIRDNSTQLFLEVGRRGVERGVFAPADLWLAVAAIGGMGIRVASWFTPTAGMTADQVADTYAEFALCIMRAADDLGI